MSTVSWDHKLDPAVDLGVGEVVLKANTPRQVSRAFLDMFPNRCRLCLCHPVNYSGRGPFLHEYELVGAWSDFPITNAFLRTVSF